MGIRNPLKSLDRKVSDFISRLDQPDGQAARSKHNPVSPSGTGARTRAAVEGLAGRLSNAPQMEKAIGRRQMLRLGRASEQLAKVIDRSLPPAFNTASEAHAVAQGVLGQFLRLPGVEQRYRHVPSRLDAAVTRAFSGLLDFRNLVQGYIDHAAQMREPPPAYEQRKQSSSAGSEKVALPDLQHGNESYVESLRRDGDLASRIGSWQQEVSEDSSSEVDEGRQGHENQIHGASWQDVTAQFKARQAAVSSSSGGSVRLTPGAGGSSASSDLADEHASVRSEPPPAAVATAMPTYSMSRPSASYASSLISNQPPGPEGGGFLPSDYLVQPAYSSASSSISALPVNTESLREAARRQRVTGSTFTPSTSSSGRTGSVSGAREPDQDTWENSSVGELSQYDGSITGRYVQPSVSSMSTEAPLIKKTRSGDE